MVHPDITGIGQLHSTRPSPPPPARPPPPPPGPPSPQGATQQVNELCNGLSFNITQLMGGNTYHNMGQRDIGGDSPGECCKSVNDIYQNTVLLSNLSDPEMSNLQDYAEGCIAGGHIPDSLRPRCMGYSQNIQNDCNQLWHLSDLRTGGLPGGDWENCCNSVNEFNLNVDDCLREEPGIFQEQYVNQIARGGEYCP